MMSLVLAAAMALPPVIPDPRSGPSEWIFVASAVPPPSEDVPGYLIQLPPSAEGLTQEWLERVVELGSRGAPVLGVGDLSQEAIPYLDGLVADDPQPSTIEELRMRHPGLAVAAAVDGAAEAVAALAAGAVAVVVKSPPESWQETLNGLLPEALPATFAGAALATGMRSGDLATVIGLPDTFGGGTIVLDGTWYGRAILGGDRELPLRRRDATTEVEVPARAGGGLLVVERPGGAGPVEAVEVAAEKLPTVAEVLARHHRAAAAQDRSLEAWQAEQRLLVRILVPELSRSFEIVFEGPAFFERGLGVDAEFQRTRVDGVSWPPNELPDLPLLEPERPPVPPLALRLKPGYRYLLEGTAARQGRRCYVLSFRSEEIPSGGRRRGTACIDAETFGLAELSEVSEGLSGEVRASRSTATYARREVGGIAVWVPVAVTADDLLAAFGSGTTVHRELTLSGFDLDPTALRESRARAWAGSNPMVRDTTGGVKRLVPDGRGGRVVEDGTRPVQRFLLAGVAVDPGIDFPIPFGGLQIQDFDFRGRKEQLRLFAAGVVNDVAWSRPAERVEFTGRAFVQLLRFPTAVHIRGREIKEEEVEQATQRVGFGLAIPIGTTRLHFDVGAAYLDFSRADDTADEFVAPHDTWETTVAVDTATVLGATTARAAVEVGWRSDWAAWGMAGGEELRNAWRRYTLSVVRETTPFPFARLHTSMELRGGHNLDRFSAPSPGRFGGLSLRGIAANRVTPERAAIARISLAAPVTLKARVEVGVDAAWIRDRRSGYQARPLSGIAVGLTLPGPWQTLILAEVGAPLTTPGPRAATGQILLLRPLR